MVVNLGSGLTGWGIAAPRGLHFLGTLHTQKGREIPCITGLTPWRQMDKGWEEKVTHSGSCIRSVMRNLGFLASGPVPEPPDHTVAHYFVSSFTSSTALTGYFQWAIKPLMTPYMEIGHGSLLSATLRPIIIHCLADPMHRKKLNWPVSPTLGWDLPRKAREKEEETTPAL